MKKVVITGINGQLGQFMAKYLIENEPDIQVVGTQRHKSYDTQPVIFDKAKVIFDMLDLSDPHSIESIIVKYKPDYFINTAANAFVGESWLVPEQHITYNSLAVLHQLEAIRKHSPHTRYFNMGTSEEFGATQKGVLNEQSILAPRSPYGASKAGARYIVKVWRESYGLYAIQGWTFNFESEIRGEKYVTRKITKGVARIAKAIKDGKPFEPIELGNLDSYRSWQYAGDVADGIWRMLNQENISEPWDLFASEKDQYRYYSTKIKEYVLSAPDVFTVRDFVEKAFEIAGIEGGWLGDGQQEMLLLGANAKSLGIAESGMLVRINPVFYRPADVTYLHGDATAIKRDLGWSPKISFDDLVKRMVDNDLKEAGVLPLTQS